MNSEQTEHIIHQFLQLSKSPIIICDSKGNTLDLNSHFVDLISYSDKNNLKNIHWSKLLNIDNKEINDLFEKSTELNNPLFGQSTFTDHNGITIQIQLTFICILSNPKTIAISFEIADSPSIIETHQNRIDFLTRQSIIFKIFNRVKSLEELIKNIIHQIYYLSNAGDVWLTQINPKGVQYLYFGLNSKKELDYHKISLNKTFNISNEDTPPNQNRVYHFTKDNAIRFNPEFDSRPLDEQLVLFFKIPSGLYFLIGLNYKGKHQNQLQTDKIFLNFLFPILYPTIENFVSKDQLVQSEIKFRNIFNNSNDSIIITDLDGNILELNQLTIDRANLSEKDIKSLNLNSLIKHDFSSRVTKYLDDVIKNGSVTRELLLNNTPNNEVYLEIYGKLIEYQGQLAILHIARDITPRKELHRKVLEARIKAEEKERSRFARDLHDGIGPYLSATKFFLQTISIEDDTFARNAIVEKAMNSIDEIIINIKEISNNLSPHVLNNFGIVAALRSFIKKVEQRTKIVLESNIESNRYEELLEISCFRILMELINNTTKYGCASLIEISINQIYEELFISFQHNGAGFDYEKSINQDRGNGIRNIQSRVSSLGGQCEFVTSIHESFKFVAIFNAIPINIKTNE